MVIWCSTWVLPITVLEAAMLYNLSDGTFIANKHDILELRKSKLLNVYLILLILVYLILVLATEIHLFLFCVIMRNDKIMILQSLQFAGPLLCANRIRFIVDMKDVPWHITANTTMK